ncbi:MAG: MotA/TolQ/ExbB proton channel family protein [Eubacteriales bacterium]|nr:MotA/TolQ/ExbB proton channel family protein [Eubacteriales bacterium]
MSKKIFNVVLFLLVAAGSIAMTILVGQGMDNMILYNFIFLGIMIFIYLLGMFGGMFRISRLSSAFYRATDEIKSLFKVPGKKETKNLSYLKGVFEHRYLDQKMDNFVTGIENSEEGLGEIDEYINEEEIDIHVHKRILEMIPDLMTGLGILGTFVGLVWGLKGFQPNSYETMTTSVESLLNGIKVSFMTSIYGISFSLIYSYGIRSEYAAMSERLQAFLERFHAYVLPTAENESRNLLLATQKTQANAMEKVAVQVSEQMAGSFERVITPTFQKMNESLDMMVTSVTRCQQDAIRDILDVFVKEMHGSFESQFSEFGATLEAMNRAQRNNVSFTTELYQNMGEQFGDLFAQQEQAMKKNVDQMQNMQVRFMDSAERVMAKSDEIVKTQQQEYKNVISYLKEAEETSAKFWVACNQAMQKYVEAAAQSLEQSGVAQQSGMEVLTANKMAVEALVKQMNVFSENQQNTYLLMEQLRALLADITVVKDNGEINLMGGRLEKVNAQNNVIAQLCSTLEDQNERQEAVMAEMSKNIKEIAKASQKKFGLFK